MLHRQFVFLCSIVQIYKLYLTKRQKFPFLFFTCTFRKNCLSSQVVKPLTNQPTMKYICTIVVALMAILTTTAQNVATGERAPRVRGERLLGCRLPKGVEFAYIGFVHSKSAPCQASTANIIEATREIGNIPCIFFTKESATATVDWLLNLADERVAIRTSALDVCKRYDVRYAPFGVIIDHKRRVLWFGNPTLLDRKQIEYIINNRKEICHLRK